MKKKNKNRARWRERIHGIFERPATKKNVELSSLIKYDRDETLSFVTPYIQSRKSVSWILTTDNMVFKRDDSQLISVVDVCGGLGGDAIQFLKNDYVKNVVSFEIEPKRYDCMVHNVNLYFNFRAYNNRFIGMNCNFIRWWINDRYFFPEDNVCVYVDLPWGGSDYQNRGVVSDLFLQYDGVKYGCLELFSLLREEKRVDSVVFKLPFNFGVQSLFGKLEAEYYTFHIKKTVYVMIPIPTNLKKNRKHKRGSGGGKIFKRRKVKKNKNK
jgi:hypothetical protein